LLKSMGIKPSSYSRLFHCPNQWDNITNTKHEEHLLYLLFNCWNFEILKLRQLKLFLFKLINISTSHYSTSVTGTTYNFLSFSYLLFISKDFQCSMLIDWKLIFAFKWISFSSSCICAIPIWVWKILKKCRNFF